MGWRENTLIEGNKIYTQEGKNWHDFPKWLKFRYHLMNFISDWLTLDAVKSGWKMPRLQFKLWLFYRKHPYLKRREGFYDNSNR